MEKGLGIAALALAIMCVFIPVYGPWVTIIAALIAMFAIGPGFGMAIGAIVINLVNLLFLSPTTWLYLSNLGPGPVIPLIWLGAQVMGLIVLVLRNKKFKPAETSSNESA